MLVFHCGLVSWGLTLIKIILLSTTEAEHHALSETIKQIVYIREVLADKGSEQTVPTPLGEDNEGCLHRAVGNRHAFDRTRHMAARPLWVIQGVKNKICEIKKFPTLKMLADFMTKPQTKDLFQLLTGNQSWGCKKTLQGWSAGKSTGTPKLLDTSESRRFVKTRVRRVTR